MPLSAFQLRSILPLATATQQFPPQITGKASALSSGGFDLMLRRYSLPRESGEAEAKTEPDRVHGYEPPPKQNTVQSRDPAEVEETPGEVEEPTGEMEDVGVAEKDTEAVEAEMQAASLLVSFFFQPQAEVIEANAPKAGQVQVAALGAVAPPTQEEGIQPGALLIEPEEETQSTLTQEGSWLREQLDRTPEPTNIPIPENTPRAAAPVEQNGQAASQKRQDGSDEAATASPEALPLAGMQSDGTIVVSQEVAPQSQAAPAASVAEQIVERLVTTVAQGSSTCEIDLKPEHLGKIAISLTMTEQGITATIRAQDEGVRHLLAAQLNDLRNTLQAQGVRVLEMEVVYDSFQDNLGQQTDYPRDAQQGAAQRSKTAVRLDIENLADARGYDFMTAVDYGEHAGVEISA